MAMDLLAYVRAGERIVSNAAKFRGGSLLFVFVVLLFIGDHPGAFAQTGLALYQPPVPKSLSDSLWDLLKAAVAQAGVEASLGIAFTVVTAWLVAKKKQLEARISGPDDDLVEKADTFRQRVMVLGLGGTGKTTMINRISGHPKADPRRKTRDFASYSIKHTVVDPRRSRDCHLIFEAYRDRRRAN
jgi:hypothetical protein